MNPRRLVRDSIIYATAQYVYRVLIMARGLIAARLLGPMAYGSWNAIQLVMDYGLLGSAGTFQGLDQTLPPRLVDGDAALIDRTKRAGLFNVLVLSSLYALLVVLYFSASNGKLIGFWGVRGVAIAGVCALLNNLGFYHTNLLRAHNRIGAVSLWFLAQGVFGAGLAFALMPRLGVWALLDGWLIGTLIASIVTQWQSRRIAPLVPRPSDQSVALIKTGAPMFLYSVSTMLRNLDRVIIFKFLDTAALGYYSLAVTGMTLLLYLPDSVSYVLYPQILRSFRAGGDRPEAVRSQVERTYRTLSILVPALCGVAYLAAGDAIEVLLPKFTPGIAAVRLVGFGAGGLAFVGLSAIVLMTLRRQAFLVPTALLGALLGAAFDLIAVRLGFGITGVAFATMTAYLLNGAVMTGMALAGLEEGMRRTLVRVARHFAPLVVSFALAFAIDRFLPWPFAASAVSHGLHLAAELALFLPAYSAIAYPFGRGTGLKQMLADLRPGWARRAEPAES